ncbi:DNA-directed RNA polymerase subunit B'' [Candidatus Woesearchaeota archaeon]|nr:DNA-directed RNA polymerase subunit B'' [Candidatus Woesearchaeota archaeon]
MRQEKNNYSRILMRKYFDENTLINADIESFNNFIENELQNIIDINSVLEPTIIPENVEEFKIKLGKISVGKPQITEADGSQINITPKEARLRGLSYAAPMFIEVSSFINGVERESFRTQLGKIPIMLHSKYCYLHGLSKKELIEKGEDPDDPGGYFIINGTEKVLVKIEDLVANRLLIKRNKVGTSEYEGTLFSERESYKIPHKFEKLKDSVFYLTFTRVKRIPVIILIKALGLLNDESIMRIVGLPDNSEVFLNLYKFVDIKTQEEALNFIAKKVGITQAKDVRIERTQEILDKYLLPHVGGDKEHRMEKAYNLCKYLKKFIMTEEGKWPVDDKDHYKNKRLKLSGDLLADLFSVNLKVLIGDLLYNFQRMVKRGKFPSIKVIIRDKLLTKRIFSSMATGTWVGGRTGVSQRIERLNFLHLLSYLQRVVSPLSTVGENFEARMLHATHMGRLCPTETPEGTNIGLRKNMALLASVSLNTDEKELLTKLKKFGLKQI